MRRLRGGGGVVRRLGWEGFPGVYRNSPRTARPKLEPGGQQGRPGAEDAGPIASATTLVFVLLHQVGRPQCTAREITANLSKRTRTKDTSQPKPV